MLRGKGPEWAAKRLRVGLFELTSCGESVPWQASAALHAWWYSGIHCIHIETSKSLPLDSTHCVVDEHIIVNYLHENTLISRQHAFEAFAMVHMLQQIIAARSQQAR